MKIGFLILLSLTCNIGGKTESNLLQCFEHLKTHLKLELNVHQLMIIAEKNVKMNDKKIFSVLMGNLPAILVSFNNASKEAVENSRVHQFIKDPKLTTLFAIVIYVDDLTDVRKLTIPIDMISSLSYNKGHPKCLFLIYSQQRSLIFEQFLRTLWKNRFLDATILHITTADRKRSENAHFLATIEQFNPYFKKYSKELCSRQVQLFPDKLRDLNGYIIKYGTYNQPMTNFVELNKTGYPVIMKGKVISFTKFLSKTMNFKLKFVPSIEGFGRTTCNRSIANGYSRQLLYNEIQLISTFLTELPNCLYGIVSFGRLDIIVLVPIIMETNDGIKGKLMLYLNASLSIVLILLIWILICILKFDHRYWKLMYLIQIVLQLGAPHEPKKARERLIFAYLLIISFVYSSNLFGALTGIDLKDQTEFKFDTIKDVHDSYLQPIGIPFISEFSIMFEEADKRNFLKKHIGYENFMQTCLQRIVKYKNISCTMQNNEADIIIESTRNVNGKAQVKVVKETLFPSRLSIFLETNSPYSEKFEFILQQASEVGIVDKWEKEDLLFFRKPKVDVSSQEIAPIKEELLLLLLFGISILGFSLSVIAFLFEILFYKIVNSSMKELIN